VARYPELRESIDTVGAELITYGHTRTKGYFILFAADPDYKTSFEIYPWGYRVRIPPSKKSCD